MENMIYKKIELENNHILVISDLSRQISSDAHVVTMKASMEIKIQRQLFFDDSLSDLKFQDILAKLGEKVIYEYKIERNFIMNDQKEKVFESLVNTFMENLGQYVAKPVFPGKFVLKQYKDRIQ